MVGPPEGDPRLPPGPRGLSREFVQAHQRERIINGMVAAVDAKGYMATSVADVLARVRVSRSAFYFAEHAQLARVCMVEALAAGPAANLRYRQALAGFVSLIEADMAANPDYPPVPRTLIFGLVGGSSATIYEEIAAGRTTELPRLVDDLTNFALAAFVGYFPATHDRIEQCES